MAPASESKSMSILFAAAFLLLAAYPLVGTVASVWMLVASQLLLLIGVVRRGQVTGAGAFIFMSFLFFGVRPVYMLLEKDYRLFTQLFRMRVGLDEVTDGLWWASAALFCFALGAAIFPRLHIAWLRRRLALNSAESVRPLVSQKMCAILMALQVLSLPVMLYLASGGRSLYGSAFGAYAYDLPVPLQAVHIMTVVVLFERFLRRKSPTTVTMLAASLVLFLVFTWLMRDVSLFRGFYVAGVMIVGIAVLQRWKGRVGYAWLILPIVLLQPFFQYLGQTRGMQTDELAEAGIVDQVLEDRTLGQAYWNFYHSSGDMNIFDTFVAAKQTEPAYKPYVWSWIYVPLHFIPRALWTGKPRKGITMDLTFTRGAPYSPGIAGMFLRDGGLLWMLFSMFLLGYLLSWLDWYVLTMPRGYLQYCLIGSVSVNAMFLTRFFLWQYFYQMLYAIIPIVALAWWFGKKAKQSAASGMHRRRSMKAVSATHT
jgi:hypothetical protein